MSKDDATWLNVAYVAFLVLMGFVAYKAVETIGIQTGWMERFEWFTYVGTLAAVVIGIGSAWYLRADKERHEYLLASIAELRKVSWPSWPDTKRMTLIVVVVCGVFAAVVGVFDLAWARVLKMLIV